ncbi:MAG: hypothetical protein EXX96DRAFT_586201 [Benjaminiella poitrasii]|nr:MAG: hypothetical protein EXX96DRAFT_586201 [Benjaminiella poitrasii]
MIDMVTILLRLSIESYVVAMVFAPPALVIDLTAKFLSCLIATLVLNGPMKVLHPVYRIFALTLDYVASYAVIAATANLSTLSPTRPSLTNCGVLIPVSISMPGSFITQATNKKDYAVSNTCMRPAAANEDRSNTVDEEDVFFDARSTFEDDIHDLKNNTDPQQSAKTSLLTTEKLQQQQYRTLRIEPPITTTSTKNIINEPQRNTPNVNTNTIKEQTTATQVKFATFPKRPGLMKEYTSLPEIPYRSLQKNPYKPRVLETITEKADQVFHFRRPNKVMNDVVSSLPLVDVLFFKPETLIVAYPPSNNHTPSLITCPQRSSPTSSLKSSSSSLSTHKSSNIRKKKQPELTKHLRSGLKKFVRMKKRVKREANTNNLDQSLLCEEEQTSNTTKASTAVTSVLKKTTRRLSRLFSS